MHLERRKTLFKKNKMPCFDLISCQEQISLARVNRHTSISVRLQTQWCFELNDSDNANMLRVWSDDCEVQEAQCLPPECECVEADLLDSKMSVPVLHTLQYRCSAPHLQHVG